MRDTETDREEPVPVPSPAPRRLRDRALRLVRLPSADPPPGRMVELPGRGCTYLTDVPGPAPDSPTVLLLHAVACTGLLTWWPTIPELARHFRVVTFDQRWHGRGIDSQTFSLVDCADDAAAVLETLGVREAIVAGYSMGSIVAQRVWRQHPHIVSGLVLAASTDRFRGTLAERSFHAGTEAAMAATRGLARSRTAARAALATGRALDAAYADAHDWALAELRSTSPWAVGQALSALGRHHSRPWLGRVDVPTAVVVTGRDRAVPPARQLALARAIPGATVHEVDAGHAACVLGSEAFVPVLVQACRTVHARRDDLARHRPASPPTR